VGQSLQKLNFALDTASTVSKFAQTGIQFYVRSPEHRQAVHTRVLLFTKQYKLPPVKGGCRCEAGKVTAGLTENDSLLLLGLGLTSPAGCLPRKRKIITGPYGPWDCACAFPTPR